MQNSPDPVAVRAELARILAGKDFATATRPARFLTYIVERTLAGKQDEIKELTLGLDVFDRGPDFDPKLDTIVRVEAVKLRKRLESYYESEGQGNPMRIDVPRGSYVPAFAMREAPPATKPARHPKWQIAALGAILIGALGLWGLRFLRPAETPSIAILPFQNFSPDPANAYFADGVVEELTDALARSGGIRVASRTSAFAFQGKQQSIREIAGRLGVKNVVEGSVRKSGNRIRVTAQLIQADTGFHLWSQTYERDAGDVLGVQQELAQTIVTVLKARLSPEQGTRLRKQHTASAQAFDAYLHAKQSAGNIEDPQAIPHALAFFQQAIEADPNYALAYAGLAGLYVKANIFGDRPAKELADKATQAAEKALLLDDELAVAHAVLGTIAARHHYDWIGAERHLRRALELQPNSGFIHNELAQNVLAVQGRFDEAIRECRTAIELDPLNQGIALGYGWILTLQRRNSEAMREFDQLPEPRSPMARMGRATVLEQMGQFDSAIAIYREEIGNYPSTQLEAFLSFTLAKAGRVGEARQILEGLRKETRFVSPAALMVAYTGLGENDAAFRSWDEAIAAQESGLIFAKVAAAYDPLRRDPRFPVYLKKIGLLPR